MEEIKRGRGQHGPIKYFTEEERKEAIRQSKNKYMAKKEWFCNVCPLYNYKLAGKWKHFQSKKHKKNAEYVSMILNKLYDLAHQQNAENVSFIKKEINDMVKKENANI